MKKESTTSPQNTAPVKRLDPGMQGTSPLISAGLQNLASTSPENKQNSNSGWIGKQNQMIPKKNVGPDPKLSQTATNFLE